MYIGVHVRRTDYWILLARHVSGVPVTVAYYHRAMDVYRRRFQNRKVERPLKTISVRTQRSIKEHFGWQTVDS